MGAAMTKQTSDFFDEIDKDGSGTLDREEIRGHMSKHGTLGQDDDFIIDALFAISDRDKNGKIQKKEFNKFQHVYKAAMEYKLDPAHTGLLDVLYRICVEQDGYELISLKTMVLVLQVINPAITKESLLEKMNGISEYSKADMLRIMKIFAPNYGQGGIVRQQPQTQQQVPPIMGQQPYPDPNAQVMMQQVPEGVPNQQEVPMQMQPQVEQPYSNYNPMNPGYTQ